jgi:hypothetical protein
MNTDKVLELLQSTSPINPKEVVNVVNGVLKGKSGRPTTAMARKKSVPVQGRVKGKQSWYPEEKKMEAACAFAVCGNSRRVAEVTGIAEATIRAWKQTEWWYDLTQRIIKEEDEELDTKLTKLVNKAVETVNDRLENGDFIYDAKRGKMVRKPMTGKDTAIVTAITLDKRQLLRGQPTSRVEKVGSDERLLRLAEQFKQFNKAKTIEAEVVYVESPSNQPMVSS